MKSILSHAVAAALLSAAPLRAQQPAHPRPGDHAGHDHAAHQGHELESPSEDEHRRAPWPRDVVELFESLPIQDGGRIKPVHTWAGFTLLRINGVRSLTTPEGEKLTPAEWALDVLFFPEMAEEYEVFLVQNPAVLEAIGVEQGEKRVRDRYSFRQLIPGLNRLFELAHEYSRIPESERSSVEDQLTHLAANVDSYLALQRTDSFVIGLPLSVVAPEQLAEGEAAATPEATHPWWTPAEILERMLREEPVPQAHRELLTSLQTLGRARHDLPAFRGELTKLHGRLRDGASRIGADLDLELTYYRTRPLYWSLLAFVFAFLGSALGWLRPANRLLPRTSAALAGLGTLLLVGAITVRCLIRGRPPVSTLYETVLFVTAVGALVALFLEFVDRRRMALAAGATFGMLGLFIANGYETLDGQDTMPSLVAVLDTNFWLATHVTAITIGYAAGMFAALLGSAYLLAVLAFPATAVGRRRDAFRALGRMVYGVLCFALVFSVVGTILGGIWANDSWGRFWGWDPKENGALLIVLSQLAILHARRGGFLREHGVCACAAFAGSVVAFSWWGVNLLGVGLHSYGFTSGIHSALWTYYLLQWAIVALGGWGWLRARAARRGVAAAPGLSTPPERLPSLRRAG